LDESSSAALLNATLLEACATSIAATHMITDSPSQHLQSIVEDNKRAAERRKCERNSKREGAAGGMESGRAMGAGAQATYCAVCCRVLHCVAVYHRLQATYEVAAVSRLLEITRFYCDGAPQPHVFFAKEHALQHAMQHTLQHALHDTLSSTTTGLFRKRDLEIYMEPTHRCHSLSAGEAYGVASVSRIDKIVGLFCKRAL